jgi:hypothetical protein
MDEQAKQFEVQTEMFTKLGVANSRQRSLYFYSTLQGIMLMFSTYPQSFPLDAVKAQVIAEFCKEVDTRRCLGGLRRLTRRCCRR